VAKKRSRSNGGMSKTSAVQAVFDMGITKPIEVSKKVKEAYGIEIKPTHVSSIKTQLKKKGLGPKVGRGRKPNASNSTAFDAAIEYVRKVGGLDRAEQGLKMIRTAKEL
jgi:hypothetical protein